MRLSVIAVLAIFLVHPVVAQERPISSEVIDGVPVRGQPAADVLASEDSWGDPTFIGGLTNSGPTAHSVW